MRRERRRHWLHTTSLSVRVIASLAVMALTALPALAQEQSAPETSADSVTGSVYRWLNFALVVGGIVYFIRKVGAPYFRQNAQSIGQFDSSGSG